MMWYDGGMDNNTDISDGIPTYIQPEDGRQILTWPALVEFMRHAEWEDEDTLVDDVIEIIG